MARSCLLPLVALSLLLPGVLDLHVHADGTCHAHPFAPEEDHDEDGGQPTTPGHRHSPWDPGCVRTLAPADMGIAPPPNAVDRLAEEGPVTLPVDRNPCPFACGPPVAAAPSIPLYLSVRHLLI